MVCGKQNKIVIDIKGSNSCYVEENKIKVCMTFTWYSRHSEYVFVFQSSRLLSQYYLFQMILRYNYL